MCCKLCAEHSISTFSHYPYTSSLVGSVASLAWNGDEVQDKKIENILHELEYEINTLGRCCGGNCGVVMHPGSFKKRDDGLATIAKSINKVNSLLGENIISETPTSSINTDLTIKEKKNYRKIFQKNVGKLTNILGICKANPDKVFEPSATNDEIDKLFNGINISCDSIINNNDNIGLKVENIEENYSFTPVDNVFRFNTNLFIKNEFPDEEKSEYNEIIEEKESEPLIIAEAKVSEPIIVAEEKESKYISVEEEKEDEPPVVVEEKEDEPPVVAEEKNEEPQISTEVKKKRTYNRKKK